MPNHAGMLIPNYKTTWVCGATVGQNLEIIGRRTRVCKEQLKKDLFKLQAWHTFEHSALLRNGTMVWQSCYSLFMIIQVWAIQWGQYMHDWIQTHAIVQDCLKLTIWIKLQNISRLADFNWIKLAVECSVCQWGSYTWFEAALCPFWVGIHKGRKI